MIDDKTKVNEDVEFDDGKELSDHVVALGSTEGNDIEQILIGHQYWEYGQEIWDTRVLGTVWGKLSPNPDGSGYVRQIIVSEGETVDAPEENVLYIYGNQKFKYLYAPIVEPGTDKVIIPAGWVRVDNLPNLHLKDGGRGKPVKENQKPRVRPQVITGNVVITGDLEVRGKHKGGLYLHYVVLTTTSTAIKPSTHIITSSNEQFTIETLYDYIKENTPSGIEVDGTRMSISTNQITVYDSVTITAELNLGAKAIKVVTYSTAFQASVQNNQVRFQSTGGSSNPFVSSITDTIVKI